MRKQYFLPAIAGVKKDIHGRGIPEGRCQEAENVLFEHGHVRTRWGYRPISANIPLSGPITNITEFEKIISSEKFLVVCTTKDIYYWDMNRGLFVPITDWITGGGYILIAGGAYTITASETPFNAAEQTEENEYTVQFEAYGLRGEPQTVFRITANNTFTLEDDFYWSPFRIGNHEGWADFVPYSQEQLEYREPLGYIENDGAPSPVPCYNFTLSRDIWGIGINLIAVLRYLGDMPHYLVLQNMSAVSFTGDLTTGTNTITNVLGNVRVGALIRFSSITENGVVITNRYTAAIIIGYANGTITYNTFDSYVVPPNGYLYGIANSSPEGVIGISFNAIHQVVTGIEPHAYESLRLITYTDEYYDGGGSESGPQVNFLVRLCDTGDMDDVHDTAILYDDEEEDNVLAITNGIQDVRVWSGVNQVSRLGGDIDFTGTLTQGSTTITNCSNFSAVKPLMHLSGAGIASGAYVVSVNIPAETIEMYPAAESAQTGITISAFAYPNKAKYIDFFGSTGMEHVIIANTTDGTVNNRQTLELSNAGDIRLWGWIYFDLIDTNDAVVGLKKLQNRIFVYKEHSITEMYATPAGGNDDPFDLIQNKVNIGSPSGRTIIDFENYHIFFGWDNIYVFDGISVTPIGDDVMDDINRSVNRPFLNRAFAFAMRNRNLYCLFLPCGMNAENCNRAYVYNYVEKHWTIWQLSHEMTCHGTYHLSEAPTWEDLLEPLEATAARGTITSGSNELTMTDLSGVEIDNVVECVTAGVLPENTIVISILDGVVYLSNNSTAAATSAVFHFYKSWRNMKMRWEDLILYEDDERHILGDVDGNIYEVSDRYFEDAGTPFSAVFITKDFALSGDPKQNFKLVETVIGICDEHFDTDGQTVHSFAISASLDFGRNWTAEIIVNIESEELDEHSGTNYVEQIVNWIERGRQVRFKIRNINGSYFRIESLNIGFNASGVLKTNYN